MNHYSMLAEMPDEGSAAGLCRWKAALDRDQMRHGGFPWARSPPADEAI